MDCKEFREVLDLYVDGELSAESMLAGQSHLKGCTGCSRVARQLGLLRNSVKRVVNQFDPPVELVDKIAAVASPGWLRLLRGLPRSAQVVWRQKVSVPMPAFALVLAVIMTLGIWMISRRAAATPPESLRRPSVVNTEAPAPESRGLDFTQFDRGERAAIEKVRLRNP
jgi:predicted anti-sigma-YlaC factor YlaD